ncbi:hypothetical protein SAMD00019534_122360 [Acytostelium subglobosum LB1]|uniref:hypothetical protein n=1 Tax=Acytostelium subglobosum LB1 TaxID=1410327 RepID=UPI000644C263|nr:hypothetical protein SAMD00019534_122360 [Acytostelium subglobosum LB1]GAM29060.1 hypothetical protein SAMD00019534_122360 [Acytostelium subglobosum LB1]|eukprot:XP_012748066.1 hypothetical protein SAMD00019534_122360 [Acytostelium subglobosum LB1]
MWFIKEADQFGGGFESIIQSLNSSAADDGANLSVSGGVAPIPLVHQTYTSQQQQQQQPPPQMSRPTGVPTVRPQSTVLNKPPPPPVTPKPTTSTYSIQEETIGNTNESTTMTTTTTKSYDRSGSYIGNSSSVNSAPAPIGAHGADPNSLGGNVHEDNKAQGGGAASGLNMSEVLSKRTNLKKTPSSFIGASATSPTTTTTEPTPSNPPPPPKDNSVHVQSTPKPKPPPTVGRPGLSVVLQQQQQQQQPKQTTQLTLEMQTLKEEIMMEMRREFQQFVEEIKEELRKR